MTLICDANSPIFQNHVQPKISPQRFASAPVFPPMRSRSGSKYAFWKPTYVQLSTRGRLDS